VAESNSEAGWDRQGALPDVDFVDELFGYFEYIRQNVDSIRRSSAEAKADAKADADPATYVTDHWIDVDDRPARWPGLHVDVASELVGGGATEEPGRPFERGVLVLWPRRRRFAVLCRSGVDHALKRLERAARLRSVVSEEP